MRVVRWSLLASLCCIFLVTSCRCESEKNLPGPSPVSTVASGTTIDGCTKEDQSACKAAGCGCLNGRCSGGKCPALNDGCSAARRTACANFACGCLNDRCSGVFCPSMSDGCTDEMAKNCAASGCGCSNGRCAGGSACPTLPDGCADAYMKSCALAGCSCWTNQCTGGACPTLADGCEEKGRILCAGYGCGCWNTKCSGGACPIELSAPGQPDTGPGSSEYPHNAFRLTQTGKTNADAVIYEPDGKPPANAPAVVIFHGLWSDSRPDLYAPLARHLARKGYIVILPLYGSTNGVHTPDIEAYAKDAQGAVAKALASLGSGPDAGAGHVKPDGRIAFVGHAVGGMVALRLAQQNPSGPDPKPLPVPVPKALVLFDPIGDDGPSAAKNWDPAGIAKIPASVKLLIVSAEGAFADGFAGTAVVKEPWQRAATKVKNVWVIRTDRKCGTANPTHCIGLERSSPRGDRNWSLVGVTSAVEGSPAGSHALDAIDWRGYWRLSEAALRTVFDQKPIGFDPFCRKTTDPACSDDKRRDMGAWTIGTANEPLPPLVNADDGVVNALLEAPDPAAKPKAPSKARH
jgi:dienelactone hydrolase